MERRNTLKSRITRGYRLERLMFVRTPQHPTPAIYYSVLTGPKGGQIFCDRYNTLEIFAKASNTHYSAIENVLANYAIQSGRAQTIDATPWDLQNDPNCTKAALHADKYINTKLTGRDTYVQTGFTELKNKIISGLII